ncbi:hypothetical protein FRX31_029425 [Thalictrum thalictroides]|uniref:Uncharacterized protein n=1 Tax=Thalictrum thalictroides TaxID=46969 RepID=A0A7J6V8I6_THATH|nr:hypothetical protein FRX31_029425 [Thalictrum thalictroides]
MIAVSGSAITGSFLRDCLLRADLSDLFDQAKRTSRDAGAIYRPSIPMELLICILIDHFVCAEVFTRELGSLYLATRFIKKAFLSEVVLDLFTKMPIKSWLSRRNEVARPSGEGSPRKANEKRNAQIQECRIKKGVKSYLRQ